MIYPLPTVAWRLEEQFPETPMCGPSMCGTMSYWCYHCDRHVHAGEFPADLRMDYILSPRHA